MPEKQQLPAQQAAALYRRQWLVWSAFFGLLTAFFVIANVASGYAFIGAVLVLLVWPYSLTITCPRCTKPMMQGRGWRGFWLPRRACPHCKWPAE